MCPICASTLAWLAFGGVSAGGLSALLLTQRRKGQDYDDDSPGRDA